MWLLPSPTKHTHTALPSTLLSAAQNFFQFHRRTMFPPVSRPGHMLFFCQQASSPTSRVTPPPSGHALKVPRVPPISPSQLCMGFSDACFPVLPTDYKLHKGRHHALLVHRVYSLPDPQHVPEKDHVAEERPASSVPLVASNEAGLLVFGFPLSWAVPVTRFNRRKAAEVSPCSFWA